MRPTRRPADNPLYFAMTRQIALTLIIVTTSVVHGQSILSAVERDGVQLLLRRQLAQPNRLVGGAIGVP